MKDQSELVQLLIMAVVILLAVLVYFIPGIVAHRSRHKHENAIVILNLLVGWTLLGWAVALVWALMDQRRTVRVKRPTNDPVTDEKTCPFCAETIKLEAKVCRYCGREISED